MRTQPTGIVGFLRRLFGFGGGAGTQGTRSKSKRRQDDFVWMAINSTIGDQLRSQPFPSDVMAASQANIVLVAAACIGYRFPDKVPAIYGQEFGGEGPRVHGEMVEAIDRWFDELGTPLTTIEDLPILKDVQTEDRMDVGSVLQWAIPAFRYGLVLGGSRPDLFRKFWENTQQRSRNLFRGMEQTNVSVPEDVVEAAEWSFEEIVERAEGFLPFYESQMGPFPGS